MKLAELTDDHRVVVCLGSGGVGKTTTSAAIALQAAMAGRRTLCLTIDPAKRLANSLGLSALNHEPQRIEPALLTQHGLQCKGELWAMMLDMKHTFDELVARHASSEAQQKRILENRIYQYVSTSLAGTQEYMAMEKLHAVHHDLRWDFIVLDTPPTTNALDFLDAPQKLVGAIDSPVMRWFVDQLEGNRGIGLLGKGAAFVLKGLSRFTGVEFLHQVGGFVTDLNELFGGFRERAQAVYDDLRKDDVAFLIVTSPAPLSVGEAVYFSRKLDQYGIRPRGMVVNRVHPALPEAVGESGALEQGLEASLAQLLESSVDAEALAAKLRRAAEAGRAMAERDREGLRRLREHVAASMSYTEIPAFARDVHDLQALAIVGAHLTGAEPERAGAAQS
ncbi:MAG: AAA family ATPase [Myxococcales bacterium]|nr:AAA family ATPase [Myxococcales bacterium]